MNLSATIQVGHVRITGTADPLLARLRLETALNGVRAPAWAGPAAILCLRHLNDPLPRAFDGAKMALWQQACDAKLEELIRKAEFPINGIVSSSAPAVLFHDRTELLACLLADWQAGVLFQHWWWSALIGRSRLQQPQFPLPLLLAEAIHLPAVMMLLAKQQLLIPVIHHFSATEIDQMIQQICFSYGFRIQPLLARVAVIPPVITIIGTEKQLTPAQKQLIAIVFYLRHHLPPLHSDRQKPEISSEPIEKPAELLIEQNQQVMVEIPVVITDPQQQIVHRAYRHLKIRQKKNRINHQLHYAAGESEQELAQEELLSEQSIEHSRVDVSQDTADQLPDPVVPDPVLQPVVNPDQQNDYTPKQYHTQLGGLFFLTNVMLFLELYGDFSQPLHPNLPLGIWELLWLVGRRLGLATAHDPIGELLLQLATSGGNSAIGAHFRPVEWRTPPIWLQPFPSEFGWSYTATRRRLQIWHPAGFPVLDTVRTQQPLSEQIQHEMALLNSIDMPIAQQKRRRSPLHTSRLQRWLGWMVAYLQARIRRALGYESDQSLQPLFALPATIWVTLDRIDLQFQLADLPIEVRLAGLDRNPGWIPASGYAIYFHFQVEE